MTQRVLIAEDEPHIAEALRFLLEREGYAVELVVDGAAVEQEVARVRPSVLILDVMLPRTTGFEVLKRLRETPNAANVSVIVLTAKGQAQDRKTATDFGADLFMTKPFANREVVDAVRRLAGP